jgi:hypothetical protein
MWAFGAAPGPASMATLMSHNGICCIATTLNAAAVPDDELFVGCIEAGLGEVTALAQDGNAPPAGDERPA